MASIEPHANKFVWWSCLISSKNRFYRKFTDILQEKNRPIGPAAHIGHAIYFFLYIGVYSAKVFLNRLFRRKKIKKILERFQGKEIILAKTFAFPTSDFSNFKDPVFETLNNHLEKKGYQVMVLYEPIKAFKKSITQFNLQDNTLSCFDFFKVRDMFSCVFTLLASYFSTLKKSFPLSFEGRNIGRPFKSLYLWEHFSPSTLHAMNYYYLCKNLAHHFHIKRYYYTYENNSWERMSLMSFRRYSPATRLIAHAHNVVPLASANLFYGRGEEQTSPRPDVILATGEIPKNILQKYGHYVQTPIKPACAIRYSYLNRIKTFPDNRKAKKILVAFNSGMDVEIIKILFLQTSALKEWKVILRFHPAAPYEEIRDKIPYPIEGLPNWQFSKAKNLEQDIENASVILYWGSTAALEAIQLGRPPIHIKLGDFNFDPLFELSRFKWVWHPDRPLKDVLQEIELLDSVTYNEHLQDAQNYLAKYFYPVTEQGLQIFEEAVATSSSSITSGGRDKD